MTDSSQYPASEPRHHTLKIQRLLSDLRDYCREDVGKVSEPKVQAMFETTAEVLQGLNKAYQLK